MSREDIKWDKISELGECVTERLDCDVKGCINSIEEFGNVAEMAYDLGWRTAAPGHARCPSCIRKKLKAV